MTSTFRLTGWHVLAMLVAFFLAIIAANAVFITLAVKSFPGEQEKKSYLQGIAFNERIAAREAQSALGWSAEIVRARRLNGAAEIELRFVSASKSPVSQLTLRGMLARPTDDNGDHPVEFVELEPGLYRAEIFGIAPGSWRLDATAISQAGGTFTLEKRLTLE